VTVGGSLRPSGSCFMAWRAAVAGEGETDPGVELSEAMELAALVAATKLAATLAGPGAAATAVGLDGKAGAGAAACPWLCWRAAAFNRTLNPVADPTQGILMPLAATLGVIIGAPTCLPVLPLPLAGLCSVMRNAVAAPIEILP